MQGKGAGAVNRVELECQVLCAALRQSWVKKDKVGAFTSIRELSHLFPDLLPPPEDGDGSNKANYYELISTRPGAGLNGIVVGYLRTTRKFLRENNPKDHRAHYNSVLNAGFVLRKPRLRLSHDLVVARRWLYESQMDDDEVQEEEVLEQVPSASPVQQQTAEVQAAPAAVQYEQTPPPPQPQPQPQYAAPEQVPQQVQYAQVEQTPQPQYAQPEQAPAPPQYLPEQTPQQLQHAQLEQAPAQLSTFRVMLAHN